MQLFCLVYCFQQHPQLLKLCPGGEPHPGVGKPEFRIFSHVISCYGAHRKTQRPLSVFHSRIPRGQSWGLSGWGRGQKWHLALARSGSSPPAYQLACAAVEQSATKQCNHQCFNRVGQSNSCNCHWWWRNENTAIVPSALCPVWNCLRVSALLNTPRGTQRSASPFCSLYVCLQLSAAEMHPQAVVSYWASEVCRKD